MNNLSPPPQPAEPDLALLYLGSLFETLDSRRPPERNEDMLDALASHIFGKRPKTLLGVAIRARAEKRLRRNLWMIDFNSLPFSEQAARVVIDSAMHICSSASESSRVRASSMNSRRLTRSPRRRGRERIRES
jgi:hypothetical protein